MLKYLIIDGNRLTGITLRLLKTAISNNTCLTKLSLERCGLSDDGTKEVMDGLSRNGTILDVNFTRNDISDESAEDILKLLTSTKCRIRYLNL